MIAAEYEIVGAGRRKSPRQAVQMRGTLASATLARTLCKVSDLSLTGARIHTYSSLEKGAVISLTLPRIGKVEAVIAWVDDYEAGCEFSQPLDDDAFANLAG